MSREAEQCFSRQAVNEPRLTAYEAILRIMKRTFGAWSEAWRLHFFLPKAKKWWRPQKKMRISSWTQNGLLFYRNVSLQKKNGKRLRRMILSLTKRMPFPFIAIYQSQHHTTQRFNKLFVTCHAEVWRNPVLWAGWYQMVALDLKYARSGSLHRLLKLADIIRIDYIVEASLGIQLYFVILPIRSQH